MRRMFSEKQIREFADAQAKAVKKDISTLVDKDGHNRFIEGTNTLGQVLTDRATIDYNKWSLSGSHLLIVVAGYLKPESEAYSGDEITISPNLPQWVLDKISGGNYGIIEYKNYSALQTSFGQLDVNGYWAKDTGLRFHSTGIDANNTLDGATFRIAFDLLIDNE